MFLAVSHERWQDGTRQHLRRLGSVVLLCLALQTASPLVSAQGSGSSPDTVDPYLHITEATPSGALTDLRQASEIRWTFDRPIVSLKSLGSAPTPDRFVRSQPNIPGRFRWVSRRTLVFRPRTTLARSTRYKIILRGISALDGAKLKQPFALTFDTPRVVCGVRSVEPGWERGAANAQFVVACSQPTNGADVADHLRISFDSTTIEPTTFRPTKGDLATMRLRDPNGTKRLLTTLVQLSKPVHTLASRRADFVATRPCPSKGPSNGASNGPSKTELLCHWIAVRGNVPGDATAEFVFRAGIRSAAVDSAGLRSLANINSGFATAATPLVNVGPTCSACNPSTPIRLTISGFHAEPEAFVGNISVRDLTTSTPAVAFALPSGAMSLPPHIADLIDPRARTPVPEPLRLDWAHPRAGHRYEIDIAPVLTADDGRTLGYRSITTFALGNYPSFATLNGGSPVIERAGTTGLRMRMRNITRYEQFHHRLSRDELIPTIRWYARGGGDVEPALARSTRESRLLPGRLNETQTVVLPLTAKPGDAGVFLAGMRPITSERGTTYDGSDPVPDATDTLQTLDLASGWKVALVQATDLAVTVKQSPSNALVAVTRLSDGGAAKGALVELYGFEDQPYWTGPTDNNGFAWAPPYNDRRCQEGCTVTAVVTSGDDLAYESVDIPATNSANSATNTAANTTTDSLSSAASAVDQQHTTLFTDRGIYRLGETVHLEGVVRTIGTTGVTLPETPSAPLEVTNERNTLLFKHAVTLRPDGTFGVTVTIPKTGREGTYTARSGDGLVSFLVSSYRRPAFAVDVAATPNTSTGASVGGTVSARYLFGAPMIGRAVTWTMTSSATDFNPSERVDDPALKGFVWSPLCDAHQHCDTRAKKISNGRGRLNGDGQLKLSTPLDPVRSAHATAAVTIEASVADLDRQVIANRTVAVVHPGAYYAGVNATERFIASGSEVHGTAIAVTPEGQPIAGRALTAHLVRWDWDSALRADVNEVKTIGAWRSTEVATRALTSTVEAVPFSMQVPDPGEYEVRITSFDDRGNWIEAGATVFGTGPGYVAWEQPADKTLNLLADHATYAVGDTAHVLVQSPWPKAVAMVTVEQAGIANARRQDVDGSALVVDVPITDAHVPNTFVSVTIWKPRTATAVTTLAQDPGRPQSISGSVSLVVPPVQKSLTVAVSTDRHRYRPAERVHAQVRVRRADNTDEARTRVTLWAVDEGVLRLTDWHAPDLLPTFYPQRDRLVSSSDSRVRVVSTTTSSKGGASVPIDETVPGGGGGAELASEQIRRDFRELAFWSSAVVTDDAGNATTSFVLPDSVTSYRIVAVVAGGADRFGTGSTNIDAAKPFSVLPSMPRFMNVGDTVEAGAIAINNSGHGGDATLHLELPTGSPVIVVGPATRTVPLLSGSSEIRFTMRAVRAGTVAFTLRGSLRSPDAAQEQDAVGGTLRVAAPPVVPEVAVSGVVPAGKSTKQKIRLAASADESSRTVRVDTSSSALVGLQVGVDNLVAYPYGCLEQRSSRISVLLQLTDLQGVFHLSKSVSGFRTLVQADLTRLETYQTETGGLSYWPTDDQPDPWLSARALILAEEARSHGYRIAGDFRSPLIAYLQSYVRSAPVADRTIALWALARAHQPERGLTNNTWANRKQLPFFERTQLLQALLVTPSNSKQATKLLDELRADVEVNGTEAHARAEETNTGSYLGADGTHLTAAMLSVLVRADPKSSLAPKLAKWLLAQRRRGVWANTFEDGYALRALTDYTRAQEPIDSNLNVRIALDEQALLSATFTGRDLTSRTEVRPIPARVGGGSGGEIRTLVATATGMGRLYYSARIASAPPIVSLKRLSRGISVAREYVPFGSKTPTTTFTAGQLIRVRLRIRTPDARQDVAISDPLPAGMEALDARLSTTATSDVARSDTTAEANWNWGIDHVELKDDRVLLFASYLAPGTLTYTYVVRATAPGSFTAPPATVEDMYHPGVHGRSDAASLIVSAPVTSATR